MSRTQAALLLAVLSAAAAALGYGLLSTPQPVAEPSSSLRPLIQRAALEPCFGAVATRAGAKGLIPDIRLPCLDGSGSHPLLATSAPVRAPAVVNVYGSWCAPCAREMPLLRRLHDEAGPRLRLLGIDTQDDHRNGLLFAIDLGQRWPALRDDDGLVTRASGGGAPKTLLIDGAGTVVHVKRGEYKTYAELRADVVRFLGIAL